MKIQAYIPTYEADRELVLVSARRLTDAGMLVVCLWDGCVPYFAKERMGFCEHRTTTFPRSGNLNGRECLLGLLETYANTPEDVEWVVKCDSDTIVRNAFARRLASSTHDAEGTYFDDASKDVNWSGAAFAIRRSVCPKLLALAKSSLLMGRIVEDYTTGELIRNSGASWNMEKGGWYHWRRIRHTVSDPLAAVMHLGQISGIPPPHFTIAARKKFIAAEMEKLRKSDPDCVVQTL